MQVNPSQWRKISHWIKGFRIPNFASLLRTHVEIYFFGDLIFEFWPRIHRVSEFLHPFEWFKSY